MKSNDVTIYLKLLTNSRNNLKPLNLTWNDVDMDVIKFQAINY